MIWLLRHGPEGAMISWPGQRMLLLLSYHYLRYKDIVSSCIPADSCPAQCLLRNQISRSLFSSLEEVWLYFYPRVGRSTALTVWRDVKSNLFQGVYFLHSIFIGRRSDCAYHQWPSLARLGKETDGRSYDKRMVTTTGECHVTPGGFVIVSGWHPMSSWHRYQDASDTRGPWHAQLGLPDWDLGGRRDRGTKNMEKQKISATNISHIVH